MSNMTQATLQDFSRARGVNKWLLMFKIFIDDWWVDIGHGWKLKSMSSNSYGGYDVDFRQGYDL